MDSVDICNLALSYLGDSATVASIDPPEGSAQAQHCARFYPMALKVMLEAHTWGFITKRMYLALLSSPYFDGFWQFAYAYPSDANQIISVLPQSLYSGVPIDAWLGFCSYYPFDFELQYPCDFQVEMSSGVQVILSNVDSAVARYTTTEVQPGLFSGIFTDALAWKLASMLAGPIIKGDAGAAESKRCLGMHMQIMAQAKAQDASQQRSTSSHVPIWVADR